MKKKRRFLWLILPVVCTNGTGVPGWAYADPASIRTSITADTASKPGDRLASFFRLFIELLLLAEKITVLFHR